MRAYTVTIRVEADDEDNFSEQDIRNVFYDLGGDAPFGFDVTDVQETP